MKSLLAILILAVLVGLMGCTASGQQNAPQQGGQIAPPQNNPQAPLKEFTITATNFAFDPSAITVKKGDRVRITLKNQQGTHGLGIPAFGVSLQPAEGGSATIEFTADKEGQYEFSCNVFCGPGHKGMKGMLAVEGK